jgi:3-oxoacyl-(acyl-carrier-protein) synthase III
VSKLFTVKLFLPAQAAAETEATIIKWEVAEGGAFKKGQSLATAESAKASFEFEAPCDGTVKRHLCAVGATIPFDQPAIEVETADESVLKDIAPQAAPKGDENIPQMEVAAPPKIPPSPKMVVSLLGIGGYLPKRVVLNDELLKEFPDMTEEYLFGVTGIRQRYWASDEEKPSDLACEAAKQAMEKSNLQAKDIEAIVLATTTPDVCMPSTACLLAEKLGIRGVPAFDINAACSGWLYGISVAKGLAMAGIAGNILVVGVELQSRLLDKKDKGTYFLFGDGAGATIVSSKVKGHPLKEEILIADPQGLRMARREYPGYHIPNGSMHDIDPWIRLDGHALFRFATSSFSSIILGTAKKSGWEVDDLRWVVPHQANGRIIRAAAHKGGIPFDRFYLNIDHVGNTSSASIPLALIEIEKGLRRGDKLIFCSVGAGITAAAISVEW